VNNLGWPDLLVLVVVGLSALAATRRGFVPVLLSLVGFVVALIVAFAFYLGVADFLSERFGWSPVWSKPVAFVGLWVAVDVVFGLLRSLVARRGSDGTRIPSASRALAAVPGALQGLLIAALILTILALVPMQGEIRREIFRAPIAGRLVETTLAVERPLEGIFGPAAREALGFITTRTPTTPGETSTESVELHFQVEDATSDPATEEEMLELVNRERTSRGLVPLEMDGELRLLARAHADDMFRRGYFAHDTPEGTDPFDRMRDANIRFGLAGENLALAPTVQIAHEGLMNSPGHRANILNGGFRKVGIGVLDGGIYGKMFVQEFTD
jgi:uncharacterized protein YkwD/uncharacterized membrane protein required for colicin V production